MPQEDWTGSGRTVMSEQPDWHRMVHVESQPDIC